MLLPANSKLTSSEAAEPAYEVGRELGTEPARKLGPALLRERVAFETEREGMQWLKFQANQKT